MNQITAVNASQRKGWPPGTPVYVARPHPLGNPFTVGKDGTRAEVLRKYENWFETHVMPRVRSGDNSEEARAFRILAMIWEIDHLVLVCWCAPEDCHVEVIKRHLIARFGRVKATARLGTTQGLLAGHVESTGWADK